MPEISVAPMAGRTTADGLAPEIGTGFDSGSDPNFNSASDSGIEFASVDMSDAARDEALDEASDESIEFAPASDAVEFAGHVESASPMEFAAAEAVESGSPETGADILFGEAPAEAFETGSAHDAANPVPLTGVEVTGVEFAGVESPVPVPETAEPTGPATQTAAESAPSVPPSGPGDVILLELVEPDLPPPTGRLVVKAAAVFLSALLHAWLLITLWGMAAPPRVRLPEIGFEVWEPLAEELPPPLDMKLTEIEYELANPNDREAPAGKALNARSLGMVQSDAPMRGSVPTFERNHFDPGKAAPLMEFSEGIDVSRELTVQGSNGEGLIQIDAALDRVTWEIAQNLKERKVLVVWLLDASGSLTVQRAKVAARLQRIYSELGALENAGQIPRLDQPLITGVVSYGQGMQFLTKEPTDKFDEIEAAFKSLQTDESGVENVFSAVGQVLKQWSKYRASNGRRIMLITVTDETGDDFGPPMEHAIAQCRRYGAKAYVLGPSAVFGRRKGFIPYVAPEDGKTYDLPVDLGPETAMMETVTLPFWFNGPQYKYLSSGIGPYALSRLVNETGGVYFMTNMLTTESLTPLGSYDDAMLKPFLPDYHFGSQQEYEADLAKHPIRAAVVLAASIAEGTQPRGTPNLDIRVTPANYRQVATTNQQSAAESQLAIDTILSAFPPGIEKELEEEPSPRWRMQFCLSYGRLLAQKTRCLEYNSALAQLKGGLTPDDVAKKSNHWIIRPDRNINYAPTMTRYARLAEELLLRIQHEAPGTPWAVLASRELQDPFGIKVEERFIPPPPPPPQAPPNNTPAKKNPVLANDKKTPTPPPARPKPAPPPKLPRV